VLALEVNGEAAVAPPSPAGGALRVPLNPPLAEGQPVVLGLEFRLTVPPGPGAGYGLLGFTDEVLSLSHVLPMVAVYDDGGWRAEPPALHGDLVYSDAAFFLVRVSAPERFTLAASGVEVNRRSDGGRQEVTYAVGPARDFFLAASERFTVQSQAADDVTIRSYTLPELEETSPTALEHAADALAILEPMLGEFPYTELDIISTGLQALGMEYPGAFALAFPLYDPQNTSYGPVVLEATIVHELAHQWFFNLVGNDVLNEPWLDEALAQFATLAYFEEAYGTSGAEGFHEALQERWRRVQEAEIPIGMPVGAYTPQEYGAIVYGRGPLFLEELRKEMGRATFADFLRDYVRSNRWQIATTEDFRSLAEDHCRCDLGLLFAGWVYPP
jgi:aminopeptidase N